jgi:hypothetical protein
MVGWLVGRLGDDVSQTNTQKSVGRKERFRWSSIIKEEKLKSAKDAH